MSANGPQTLSPDLLILPQRTVAAAYTIQSEATILVAGSGARAITLPAVAVGRRVRIKDSLGNASGGTITITPASGLIDGAADLDLVDDFACVELESNGVNWFVISTARVK